MIKKPKLAGVLFVSLLLILLCSCGSEPSVYRTGFIAMDTYIDITVYGKNAETAPHADKDEVLRIEALMSENHPDSVVKKLNEMGG